MKRSALLALMVLIGVSGAASAASIDKALRKLGPEERSHQACIYRGLEVIRRETPLRRADRMTTFVFGRAVLDGTHLTAKGGGVRADGHWYALSFACDLTADYMQARTFTYKLGPEIPKKDWDKYGLWGN
jgi:hypothetical protein